MKRTLVAIVLMTIVFALAAYAPPHPKYNGKVKLPRPHSSAIYGKQNQLRNTNVPDSVLVLMVQFSDVNFVTTPQYPDSLVHDDAFFDRYMYHLTDYYNDASHGNYLLQYSVHEQVITLTNSMTYYGVDDTSLVVVRQAELARDIIQAADSQIDFNQYDAIVVFHAGAGQESDVERRYPEELWSTFISRLDLQYGFDPENDDYPGVATNDGKYIKEMLVVPEWEWQDYFPIDNSGYVFNTLGVLANQFGHLLGMPNLYDNDWSNGASEGVGNFCIMGSGAWNANGYVPALPSAFCRTWMGWEQPLTITTDTDQINLDYLLSHEFNTNKVVKLPISDHEYYLLENRNQNPDNSFLNGQASFTFILLEEGQAYYYHDPADTLPYDPVPKFEFMRNRFKGCEWDFFLPGYGGPLSPEDGSGILIWHVDDNVIMANFKPEEGIDHINSIASHKGVDLEEASGIQDLDATNLANPFFRGGPTDAYRAGNNAYFGQLEHDGFISQPTADSYYGGIPVEVSNISFAGQNMTFDVKFRWSLDAGYVGSNSLPAAFIDFDQDGSDELFYPMPDGKWVMWKNDVIIARDTLNMNPVNKVYACDPSTGRIYIPYDRFDLNNTPTIALYNLYHGSESYFLHGWLIIRPERKWAAGPIMMNSNTLVLPLNMTNADSTEIVFQSSNSIDRDTVSLPGQICTNILFSNQKVISISKIDGLYSLNYTDYATHVTESHLLPIAADSIITSIALAPLSESLAEEAAKDICLFDLIICAGQGLYVCNQDGTLKQGYPALIPFPNPGLPSFADVDKNGHLETLIGGENNIAIFSYDGSLLNYPLSTVTNPDTLHLSSGIWATDFNEDGNMEILGHMSMNRLYVWKTEGYPPYNPQAGYPVSNPLRSLSYPMIGRDSTQACYIYSASNSGKIYRQKIDSIDINQIRLGWFSEYGNLFRNAVYVNNSGIENQYATKKLFVPGEVYIYPNPWKQMHSPEINFRIMTSRKADVDVKIFDIEGKQLYANKITCEAYLPNQHKIQLPVKKMSSGIYLAEIYSNGERKSLKFAIEK